MYNISIGSGGAAAADNTNGGIGKGGKNTLFYKNISIIDFLASGASQASGSFNSGPEGQGYTNVTQQSPTIIGTVLPTSGGGNGGFSFNNNQTDGESSDVISITLPFLPIGFQTYYLSGGGGTGNTAQTKGGAPGNGTGGNYGGSAVLAGGSASNYGGGGGGGTYNTSHAYSGGNGGVGVVMVWWPN